MHSIESKQSIRGIHPERALEVFSLNGLLFIKKYYIIVTLPSFELQGLHVVSNSKDDVTTTGFFSNIQ